MASGQDEGAYTFPTETLLSPSTCDSEVRESMETPAGLKLFNSETVLQPRFAELSCAAAGIQN